MEARDASTAPVPGATVVLEHLGYGVKHRFETGADGSATVSNLPPGRYRLHLSKYGFATHTDEISVAPSQPVVVAIVMEVGVASYAVDVAASTPLAGLERSLDEIPAPTQTATDRDIDASGALDLSDFLNRRLNGVHLNEVQGNPMQADLNYRGYTASPLLGTPQGISIFMDGMRLNQPFGDVVSWDLIPRAAIAEVALIPGSNPLFGLNTLGGALSLRTKDGVSHGGTSLQLSGGSFGRKVAEFEHGGSRAGGLHWYVAGNLFFDDGWRETSTSNVRQLFAKLGRQRERTSFTIGISHANNALIGNALQEFRLLERDYASIYTKPDVTANRAPLVNLSVRHIASPSVSFSGNAYFRYIRTRTVNGDINEESLHESVYQPSAAEQAALAAAGYTGFPTAGANAANTPFPFWRCIGNVLLDDEPEEKCNGLLNRTRSQQRNYGVAGQIGWFTQGAGYSSQLTVGAAYDGNSVGFGQSSELGYLNADRSITGAGAFDHDAGVDLSGRIHSGSLYAADTLAAVSGRLNLTLSGRFNRTSIDNLDRLDPLEGTGSLTGRHVYQRLNPAVGATWRARGSLNLYAGYSEGSRAPTSIELGCADPATPCRLPNALAGDPPLLQVVTRTVEAGVRGGVAEGKLHWSAGWFRAANRDDILFVASAQAGFGHFTNFGQTRRQGLELDTDARLGRVTIGGGYTFLDATFQSREEVNGAGNSTNGEALEGNPGLEGTIMILPGQRIPLIPRHMVKLYADLQATPKMTLNLGVAGISSSYARGNENNQHEPDGTYYLGEGTSPGYAVANFGARYQLHPRLQLFVQVSNLLDRRYYTGAQIGSTGITPTGAFIARPFPPLDGEYPVQQSTFVAPGAPRGAWAGVRYRF